MNKILSAEQIKTCDSNTINMHGIPSLVLMERAAISLVISTLSHYPNANTIYIICGPGNNGGDGVAVARLLYLKQKNVQCVILGDSSKYSEQLNTEINIAKSYDVPILYDIYSIDFSSADLIIDAMFGIGLTRGLENEFAHAASLINKCGSPILSIDMPSGYHTDTGKLLGDIGIHADITITFAYMKKGLVLGDCKASAGQVYVADVGIYTDNQEIYANIADDEILSFIKPRPTDANKGTCGKLLIIAGSEEIYGACYLAAKSALTTGTGLVKVFTHKNNISNLQKNLPEAMYLGYDSFDAEGLLSSMNWADVILIGPGLGTGELSSKILTTILNQANCPVVFDADGLNLLAEDTNRLKEICNRCPVILTPHLKEMERLTGTPVTTIKYNIEDTACSFAKEYNCTIILKDATTIVASPYKTTYIISGNESLATPGSGDVLAGIVASLIAQAPDNYDNMAIAATHLHGKAGRIAGNKYGTKGVLANDIIEALRTMPLP